MIILTSLLILLWLFKIVGADFQRKMSRNEYVALKETIKEKMNTPTTGQVTYKLLASILEALNQYEVSCRKK